MAKPDGRIEKGQRLSTAISARAWNRAQDAADIVLGARPGFAAESVGGLTPAIVAPCVVTSTISGVKPGHVVRLTSGAATVSPSASNDSRAAGISCLQGNVAVPVTLANYELAKEPLAVIVGGVEMPSPGQPRVVNVCLAGMCVARVRSRFSGAQNGGPGAYKYISLPVKRVQADTDALLTGYAEASSCGTHQLLRYLGYASTPGVDLYYAVVLM